MRYLLVLVLLLAACGGTAPQPTVNRQATPPTVRTATGPEAEAFAQEACRGSQYSRCVDSMLTFIAVADAGQLVAICDYEQGEGEFVLIDDEAEAEEACSADGLITSSRVANVVEVP